MTKPDWKDAPGWARWLAQDKDGEWYWHGSRPNLYSEGWEGAVGAFIRLADVHNVLDFTETLEKRP